MTRTVDTKPITHPSHIPSAFARIENHNVVFSAISHPGVCPTFPTGLAGPCVDYCDTDEDCPPNELCCSNGCGHDCM